MKNRALAIVIGLLAVVGILMVRSRRPAPIAAAQLPPNARHMEEVPQVPADPPAAENKGETADDGTPAGNTALPGPVPVKPKRPALAAAAEPPAGPEPLPGVTPLTVLENMRSVFHQYAARFGGNPVGNNPEITAALNGGNPKQVVFLNSEDDGLRVNDRGELIDNWGTPFFFHQLSRTEMEIRSAGPDRKMWTRDDLVIK